MTALRNLLTWLAPPHSSSRTLFVSSDGQHLTDEDWLQSVRGWQKQLHACQGQAFAVYHSDVAEFSAIVIALWLTGKRACLASHNGSALCVEMASQVDGFVGEFDSSSVQYVAKPEQYSSLSEEDIQAVAEGDIDLSAPLLGIYTSGSQGSPILIVKQLRQVFDEVHGLAQLWPLPPDAGVLSTVSHQHIYGFLFAVLWPLTDGRSMGRFRCAGWNDVWRLRGACAGRVAVVSSPSHLQRFQPDTDPHQAPVLAVFSSGSPLASDVAQVCRDQLCCAVAEVYGSSETGGIAQRQLDDDIYPAWLAMPGIQVRCNGSGCLELCSPYLEDPLSWHPTADMISMVGARSFVLKGRADRVIKVEGKRCSLDEIERALAQLPEISEARCLVIRRKRDELAAVVILSAVGSQYFNNSGRAALVQELKTTLGQRFEQTLLPRRWRFVTAMPINDTGKVVTSGLQELFADVERSRELPQLQSERRVNAQAIELDLALDANLSYFDGHFPERPILPGVVQVHWAVFYAQQHLGVEGAFRSLERIKFMRVIEPLMEVTLRLSYEPGIITFAYTSVNGQHSQGIIRLDPA